MTKPGIGTGPLEGIRVVEFAQNAAAPHCGRLLAGMGADVVKVEPINGDAMRDGAHLTGREGRAYAVINPGKRAMRLDLTKPGSGRVVTALIAWADVSVVAFKAPDLERFGLTWEAASAINPRLVHLVLNAFGPKGPDADLGGYDVLVQGVSGVGFSMNRADAGVPTSTRPAVFDFSSGMMATAGVLAGLRHRDQTGEGQQVDVSLLGTAMSIGTPMVYRFEQDVPTIADVSEDMALLRQAQTPFNELRQSYESRATAPGAFRLTFRHYVTADGMISVAGLSPGLIRRFYEILELDMPDHLTRLTPEFDAVVRQAEETFLTRTTDEWVTILRAANYPCSRYNLPYEAIDDPQIRANDYLVDLDHDVFGTYTTSGMPLHMSASSVGIGGPSPQLGEHTHEVMAELGFTEAERAALEADGVVLGLYDEDESRV